MKLLVSIFFLIIAQTGQSQTKLLVADTNIVDYLKSTDYEGIDSVVFIKNSELWTICDYYEIYFDSSFRNLAYKSQSSGDTCITQDFWRSGKLKRKTTYIKKNDGPLWWYDEVYCKSGQTIFKGPSPNQTEKKLYISYYCNGNKRLEFYHLGMSADGKMTKWYENGKVELESYYDNNKPAGKWKYFNEKGKLKKTERYVGGEIVESINY